MKRLGKMNKKGANFYFPLVFTLMFSSCASSNPGSYRLTTASDEWPLIFEDGEHSHEVVSAAVSDINLVYSRFTEYRILAKPTVSGYRVGGRTLESKSYLDYRNNPSLYVPEALWQSNFGDFVEVDGTHHIVVPEVLLGEYEKAITRLSQHKVAFSKLDSFLEFVNGLEDSRELSDDDVIGLFYAVPPPASEKLSREHLEDFVKDFGMDTLRRNADETFGYDLFRPSILDCLMLKEELPEVKKDMLICKTYTKPRKSDRKLYESFLGYSRSGWHIILRIGGE